MDELFTKLTFLRRQQSMIASESLIPSSAKKVELLQHSLIRNV